MPRYSVVEYFPSDGIGHQCGYCGGSRSSLTHGMWGHVLRHEDYQDLIDRGWRRSGKYLYKSMMNKTCCPLYTIRCDALSFKPSKSHKKVIKRFRNFIINGRDLKEGEGLLNEDDVSASSGGRLAQDVLDEAEAMLKWKGCHPDQMKGPPCDIEMSISNGKVSEEAKSDGCEGTKPCSSQKVVKKEHRLVNPGLGADPNKPKARKAKDIRRERALLKGKNPSTLKTNSKNIEKSLEDYINEPFPESSKHKFEIRTVLAQTSSPSFESSYQETLKLYKRYQMKIHGDKEEECKSSQFTRFLCNSSIKQKDREGIHHGYGAFHQQYVIDDKIVAVGVVDILRDCLSSVYFFYNPDYSFLSLGTLSSLFEIAYTRKLSQAWPDLQYYYMGFYIHSCPKMRYKAQYSSSYLLCPETYKWVSVDSAKPLLDQSKYAKLYTGDDVVGEELDLDNVLILHYQQAMSFEMYKQVKDINNDIDSADDSDGEEVKEYAHLVGETVAKRMLLFRS